MYGVGGSGAGFAEVYAMKKIYKEKIKMKLAAAAAEDGKDNVGKKIKTKEIKKSKKTRQNSPRVSSADI
ncbi:unnamed protein product [Thlaspi arvense]|uniref:Uncharacterized protein n=1 Tax=Thlaspi arvense TaxID=13288 RepID=A0AAU9SPP8_THLAR|nr:unnamed protein product [Thlaspi arvense]